MSLLYVIAPRKNPLDKDADVKYYLQSKIRGRKSHKALVQAAAKNTTINAREIDAAVSVWIEALTDALSDGFSVEIEGLGTFSASIKSEGSATEAEATAAKVKNISLVFRAKPEMHEQVGKFKLEKYLPGGTL